MSRVLPSLASVSAADVFVKPALNSYSLLRTSQGNLPVYRTFRSQNVWTDVKRVQGNVVSFRNDLQAALAAEGVSVKKEDFICVLGSNTLKIRGDYSKLLHKLLAEKF